MERTNFYDAIYSPVVLVLDAVVVGVVMLLSASGSGRILDLFGMSVGRSGKYTKNRRLNAPGAMWNFPM